MHNLNLAYFSLENVLQSTHDLEIVLFCTLKYMFVYFSGISIENA
jgi:hypothetical protein